MHITMCEIDDQSKFNAWNRALKTGALGQLRGMGKEGFQDGGHMYTFVYMYDMYIHAICHANILQNHHNTVK